MSQLWVTLHVCGGEVVADDLEFPFEAVNTTNANWTLPEEYRRPGCQLVIAPLVSDGARSVTLQMEVMRE